MSVLDAASSEDVRRDPYPHICMHNAVDEDLCNRLLSDFPQLDTVTEGRPQGSNERFSYAAHKAMNDVNVSDTWKEFLAEHISQKFLGELLRLFEGEIRRTYPDFESRFGAFDDLRAGTRGIDSFDDVDVLLDAQICVNTPVVSKPDSVRGPHVDHAEKLFAGLFYLRSDEDNSTGGGFRIYGTRRDKQLRFWDQHTSEDLVELVDNVQYKSNVFVMFLNSIHAIHGVSVRSNTTIPRMFMNIVAEVREPLFDLRDLDPSLFQRAISRLGIRSM